MSGYHTNINILNRQAGLSLIEMMVAITIGLILLAGIANIFSANKKAYRYNDALNEVNDNGNYALDFIASNLAMIGYVPRVDTFSEFDWNSDGAVDKSDIEYWAYGSVNPIRGIDLTGAGNDVIQIALLADPDQVADGSGPLDCTGLPASGAFGAANATLAASGTYGYYNTIQILNAGKYTGRPTLTCNNRELVDGIEHLQILYGVDTDKPGDGQVDKYMSLSELDVSGVNPLQVITVRIGIIVSSSKSARPTADARSWTLLGETVGTKNDLRLRKIMTMTVKLRNRCSRIPGLRICA